ncbi:hypothetical protein AVEN_115361-1 [Araneus ventricosus]|uniref:Uncharacterized protein n=1 Tax=Araneus ventricosus TaxID=182803 RepID=A0A4Y1ZY67_ARAVE|nr:hypothetical protein AVEN_115361-1 [Araneus ventricosus]
MPRQIGLLFWFHHPNENQPQFFIDSSTSKIERSLLSLLKHSFLLCPSTIDILERQFKEGFLFAEFRVLYHNEIYKICKRIVEFEEFDTASTFSKTDSVPYLDIKELDFSFLSLFISLSDILN